MSPRAPPFAKDGAWQSSIYYEDPECQGMDMKPYPYFAKTEEDEAALRKNCPAGMPGRHEATGPMSGGRILRDRRERSCSRN